VAVEGSKYKVIEDRRDIICSKLCFHLFHEKCIYAWIERGDLAQTVEMKTFLEILSILTILLPHTKPISTL
jgi:hypothetical protein